jgi:hypothetical protein
VKQLGIEINCPCAHSDSKELEGEQLPARVLHYKAVAAQLSDRVPSTESSEGKWIAHVQIGFLIANQIEVANFEETGMWF